MDANVIIRLRPGPRARGTESLQHCGYRSKIQFLNQQALVYIQGVEGMRDGWLAADYEGRGAHRDVYRILRRYVIKIHQPEEPYNLLEAIAMRSIPSPYFVKLRYHGKATVQCSDETELEVDALICDFGGKTVDQVMSQAIAVPLTTRVLDWLIKLYTGCGDMVFDGRKWNIAYADLRATNISTLFNLDDHIEGVTPVTPLLIDAETCCCATLDRKDFNRMVDEMLAEVALMCSSSRYESWQELSCVWRKHTQRLCAAAGDAELEDVHDQYKNALEHVQAEWIAMHSADENLLSGMRHVIVQSYSVLSTSPTASSIVDCRREANHQCSRSHQPAWQRPRPSVMPPIEAQRAATKSMLAPERVAPPTSKRRRASASSDYKALPSSEHYAPSICDTRIVRSFSISDPRSPLSMACARRGATGWFGHEPVMTRVHLNDVVRFLHMVWLALRPRLNTCSHDEQGRPQVRASQEAEFMKYGIQQRVFQSISWFSKHGEHWFSPAAAYYTLIEEFKLLEGYGHKQYAINGFHFLDDYERDDTSRRIVVSYEAVGPECRDI